MNSIRIILAFGFSSSVFLHDSAAGTYTPANVQMSVDGNPWPALTLCITGYDETGHPIYNLDPRSSAYQADITGLGFRDEQGMPITGPGWVVGDSGSDRIAFTNTTADTDPFISYAISVTDSGAPSTFSFSFSTGIALPYGATLTRASIGATLTDGGLDGASITNLFQDSYLNTAPGQDMFVDIGPVGFTAAVGGTAAQAFNVPFGPGPAHSALSPFTTLTVVASFNLSGNDDNVGLTGRAEIVRDTSIPEPGSAILILTGIGALAARRTRRA